MELLHRRCCGIDVHKETVVACLRLVSDSKVTTEVRTFQTTTADLLRLSESLHGDDIKRRRKNMLKRRLPHLAAEQAGAVIGYAYAVPFRKRPAYRYAVKHSIYVHPDHLHSGVGRRLLPALIDACAAAGYRQMIAYIDVTCRTTFLPLSDLSPTRRRSACTRGSGSSTPASSRASASSKYGRWTDTILMQRALGPGDTTPPGAGDGTPIPQTDL